MPFPRALNAVGKLLAIIRHSHWSEADLRQLAIDLWEPRLPSIETSTIRRLLIGHPKTAQFFCQLPIRKAEPGEFRRRIILGDSVSLTRSAGNSAGLESGFRFPWPCWLPQNEPTFARWKG